MIHEFLHIFPIHFYEFIHLFIFYLSVNSSCRKPPPPPAVVPLAAPDGYCPTSPLSPSSSSFLQQLEVPISPGQPSHPPHSLPHSCITVIIIFHQSIVRHRSPDDPLLVLGGARVAVLMPTATTHPTRP